MTPMQKIKHAILSLVAHSDEDESIEVNADNIDSLYRKLTDEDGHWDAMNEVRAGTVETDLACEYSRHYESKAVAMQVPDGSWVGWTYWYGGGKHGEPEAVDWMEDAYDLSCVEEEKLVVVRTFEKVTKSEVE